MVSEQPITLGSYIIVLLFLLLLLALGNPIKMPVSGQREKSHRKPLRMVTPREPRSTEPQRKSDALIQCDLEQGPKGIQT